MTTTHSPSLSRHDRSIPAGPGRIRIVLAAGAVVAALPYLVLKGMWLSGSTIGLDDTSVAQSTVMEIANAGTAFMALTGAALAVAMVRPIGARLPAWLVQVPMFVGTGLLGGILVMLPIQLALGARGSNPRKAPAGADPIQAWVYTMVYGGFALLGICLLSLFALYSWDRWVRPGGWTTPLGAWHPAGRGAEGVAMDTGLVLVGLCVAELIIATRADIVGGQQVMSVVMAGLACAGLVALARRAPARLPGASALIAAYAGSAAVSAWGLFYGVILSIPNPLVGDADIPSALPIVEFARGLCGAAALGVIWRLRPRRR